MKRLSDFYTLMEESAALRRDVADFALIEVNKPTRRDALRKMYENLRETPKDEQGRLLLEDDQGRQITLSADYEMAEFEKDLYYLDEGEEAFLSYLGDLHPRFGEEVKNLLDFLGPGVFDAFYTDRDGTVNNYCGRYRSSVQSAYNALFLTRFGRTVRQKPVILTSAPLENTGIVDLSVIPEDVYLLAGSKGREYRDIHGDRQTYPQTGEDAQLLKELNDELERLLAKPENRIFTQIGSSFQRKFGETTVAHQDVYGSVPEEESRRFVGEVRAIVDELNGSEERLVIEDTGKDLEIAVSENGAAPSFDKGAGIEFLIGELGQTVENKRMLVCGDTSSDLPMVGRAMDLGADVTAVFVTTDEELRKAVVATGARCHFVSNPDVLVAGLNLVAKQK